MRSNCIKAFILALLLMGLGSTQSNAGSIIRYFYDNIPGGAVADLYNATNAAGQKVFPLGPNKDGSPLQTELATVYFEGPPPASGNGANDYGSMMEGYLEPPVTGNYVFYIASDDASELFVSTDANPANKQLVSSITGWTGYRAWTSASANIPLVKGQKYYVQMVHKEGGGGDHVSVGWKIPKPVAPEVYSPLPQDAVQSDGSIMQRPIRTLFVQTAPNTFYADPSIVQQPMDVTVTENRTATLAASVNASQPASYQWYKAQGTAGVTPIPGAVLSSYNFTATLNDGGRYSLLVTSPKGVVLSRQAIVTVVRDTGAPALSSASGVYTDPYYVRVVFSEPVDPLTAGDPANYALDNGAQIFGVTVENSTTVVLYTSVLALNKQYTVTGNGIKDIATIPNTMVNSQTSFTIGLSLAYTAVVAKYYNNISGTDVKIFDTDAKLVNDQYDTVQQITVMETQTDRADNYAGRIQALLVPPTTGNYRFAISADDGCRVFLSTDATAANKQRICGNDTGWSGSRQYLASADRMSAAIPLVAGKEYYIEAQMKEGGGGDNMAVAWQKPGDPAIANNQSPIPVTENNQTILKPFTPFTPGPVFFKTDLPAFVQVAEGNSMTLSVAVDGTPNYSYQWYRNGVAIPGATSFTYSIARTAWADNHSWFTVLVKNNFSMVASTSCELRLTDDVTPPVATSAFNFFPSIVSVTFSEPVQADMANYTLKTSGGATVPINAVLGSGDSVELTLANPLVTFDSYTLTVSGVKDQSHLANPMAAAVNFEISGFNAMLATVGTATNQPSSALPPKITVISGGNDIWDAADGFTFNYQEITGDFDYQVRIESLTTADFWVKGGLMMRESVNAGSRHVMNIGAPSSGGWNNVGVQYRPTTDGASSSGGSVGPLNYPNVWVRMQRVGNMIYSYYSNDGKTWNNYDTQDTASYGGGAFPSKVLLGIALTSHNTGQTTTGIFSDFNRAATALTITQQPKDTTINEGYTATLSVVLSPIGVFNYQWYSNGVAIAGNNSATLTTARLKRDANGTIYRVVITHQGKTYTSADAKVTIINDTSMPQYVSGAALYGSPNFVMKFDEPMDPVSVADMTKYKILAGSTRPPSKAVPALDDLVVVTMPLGIGTNLTVGVNGITDYGNNPYFGTNVLDLVRMTAKDIGTPNATNPAVLTDPIMLGTTYPVSANGFEVLAGGSDIWNNADGFHFTYTSVTGDFDVRVRVESLKKVDNWTKAGLMIREDLEGTSRNINMVVDPADGANQWELNQRATKGGSSGGWGTAKGPMTYPNAWIRLLRSGNTFTGMRSTNGTTWEVLGTITPSPAYPANPYVGMATSSHNNSSGVQNQTVAKYRDFLIKSYVPLTVVSLVGNPNFNQATLTLSIPVTESSATNLANYSFDNGLTINKATLDATGTKITFDTPVQVPGTKYTLTINNVNNGDGLALNNVQASFTSWVLSSGFITRNVWYSTPTPLTNLLGSAKYPNSPDEVTYLNSFESPSNVADNYSQKVFGWIMPPITGNYVFYLASTADSQLWLSTNDAPAIKTKIAEIPAGGYANPREWQNGRNNATQKSAAIALEAGRLYYIEAIMAAGTGNDNLAVTWTLPGDTSTPANGSMPICGSFLNTWMNPDGVGLQITSQPQSVTVPTQAKATFTVTASYAGTLIGYQWQKQAPGGGDWMNIAGAITPQYTTARAVLADSGTKYRVKVFAPGNSITSSEATLTVVTDTTPPMIDKIGSLYNASVLAVRFTEEVDASTATNVYNYIVYAGVATLPIQSATVRPDGATVILQLQQTITNRVVIWFENIKDLNGNMLPGIFRSSDVVLLYNKDLGTAGVDPLVAGATYGVSQSEFELVAGGSDIGGTADGAQFAYKQVTGDFDVKVRLDSLQMRDAATKAGLAVRLDLDADSIELCLVATPAGGLNTYQVIGRLAKGTAAVVAGSGGIPAYPNAWMRLQRVGDTFNAYIGNDGVNWVNAYTFSSTVPATTYVGMIATAKNNTAGNATSAQFRQFQIAASSMAPMAPTLKSELKIKVVNGNAVITWPAESSMRLQSKPLASPHWTTIEEPADVDGNLNTITMPIDSVNRVYRLIEE